MFPERHRLRGHQHAAANLKRRLGLADWPVARSQELLIRFRSVGKLYALHHINGALGTWIKKSKIL